MKNLKTFLLLLCVLFAGNLFVQANSFDSMSNPIIEDDVKIVQSEVFNLLSNKSLEISEERLITVILTVNRKNEIIVLDIGSNDDHINDFIKRNLNDKLLSGLSKAGRTAFICPVRLIPSST